MKDVNQIFSTTLSFIKDKNIIENIILFGSIVSANFASYIAYFDINSMLIVDATTISKYLLGIVILFVAVSAGISIIMLFLQNYVLLNSSTSSIFGFELSKEMRQSLHNIISNKVLKFSLSTIIFSFLYVGEKNSIIILLLFTVYFASIVFIKHRFDQEGKIVSEEEPNSKNKIESFLRKTVRESVLRKIIKSFKASPLSLMHNIVLEFEDLLKFSATIFNEAFDKIAKGQYFQFLLGKVGIMLIFLSLSLGISRAIFVENNIHVKLNDREEVLVLYIATDDGIGLFDKEKKQVLFSSWGSVSSLIFLPEKRRSLTSRRL